MDLDADMKTNMQNVACFGKIMSICNKQHLSNIWRLFIKKLSNAEVEFKKMRCLKKKCILQGVSSLGVYKGESKKRDSKITLLNVIMGSVVFSRNYANAARF